MKNKRGTNQYRSKRSLWKVYLFIYFTIVFCVISANVAVKITPKPSIKIVSPLAYAQEPTPTPTEHELIVSYIHEIFGKDAPVAFQLLQKCGENAALNPRAINVNWSKTTGIADSRDWGVFQINDKWQAVQGKWLLDWKINIQIAHDLFIENYKHFNLWTGGRKCNI